MTRFMRWLIRLYPRAWRERYGEEFAALIEDSPSRWPMIFDLLKGACEMQFAIPNFGRMLAGMAAAGLIAGFAVSYAVTPRYESSVAAVLSVPRAADGPPQGPADVVITLLRHRDEVFSRLSLSGIIQDPKLELYPQEVLHTALEDVIDTMRADIRFELTDQAAKQGAPYVSFRIGFSYRDAEKAQKTVQALITKMTDSIESSRKVETAAVSPRDAQIARLEARIDQLERRVNIRGAALVDDTYPNRINNPYPIKTGEPSEYLGSPPGKALAFPMMPNLPIGPTEASAARVVNLSIISPPSSAKATPLPEPAGICRCR